MKGEIIMRRILVYSFCFMFILVFNVHLLMLQNGKLISICKKNGIIQTYESVTNIPWYYLAAIDQYERNVRQVTQKIYQKQKE